LFPRFHWFVTTSVAAPVDMHTRDALKTLMKCAPKVRFRFDSRLQSR
jgi:hypothetical protein